MSLYLWFLYGYFTKMIFDDWTVTAILISSVIIYPLVWYVVLRERKEIRKNKFLSSILLGFPGVFVNALVSFLLATLLTFLAIEGLSKSKSTSEPVVKSTPDVCAVAPTSLRSVLSEDDFNTAWQYPRKFYETIKSERLITSKICQVCLCSSNFDDREYQICENSTFTPQKDSNAVKKCVY